MIMDKAAIQKQHIEIGAENIRKGLLVRCRAIKVYFDLVDAFDLKFNMAFKGKNNAFAFFDDFIKAAIEGGCFS